MRVSTLQADYILLPFGAAGHSWRRRRRASPAGEQSSQRFVDERSDTTQLGHVGKFTAQALMPCVDARHRHDTWQESNTEKRPTELQSQSDHCHACSEDALQSFVHQDNLLDTASLSASLATMRQPSHTVTECA